MSPNRYSNPSYLEHCCHPIVQLKWKSWASNTNQPALQLIPGPLDTHLGHCWNVTGHIISLFLLCSFPVEHCWHFRDFIKQLPWPATRYPPGKLLSPNCHLAMGKVQPVTPASQLYRIQLAQPPPGTHLGPYLGVTSSPNCFLLQRTNIRPTGDN